MLCHNSKLLTRNSPIGSSRRRLQAPTERRQSIDAQGDGMAVHAIGKQGFKGQSNSGICYVLRRPQSSLRGRVRASMKRREGVADCGAVDSVRDDVR